MIVYIVRKHPKAPYRLHTGAFFSQYCEVVSVHADRASAEAIEVNKNLKSHNYIYSVIAKNVKEKAE